MQADLLLNSGFAEDVVAPTRPFLETESKDELAKVGKLDGRIGGAAQDAVEQLFVFPIGAEGYAASA
ncbi:MAG: hypothetical protein AAF624_15395 [Bacteroidota bacterium]